MLELGVKVEEIRSPAPIVRPCACGASVLLTSQNLVPSVRRDARGPSVVLSLSVKNSVNAAFAGLEHQIPCLVLNGSGAVRPRDHLTGPGSATALG